MKIQVLLPVVLVLGFVCVSYSQADRAGYAVPQQMPQDPMANISMELTNISRSVALLSDRLKTFVDKFEKVGGLTLSEKQQRFIMGLEILVRSEQRVGALQKNLSDAVEKQVQIKTRLTQIEIDLRPQSIDRDTMYQGAGVQAVEVRENRLAKLVSEQRSLQQLLAQLERNVSEAEFALREAQSHVARLRRSLLPQIEKELSDGF